MMLSSLVSSILQSALLTKPVFFNLYLSHDEEISGELSVYPECYHLKGKKGIVKY